MHDARIKMKDGREFCGPIWEFKPKEGYLTIPSDENAPEKIYFRDIESAKQLTRIAANGLEKDIDLLRRARHEGWIEFS